MNLKTAPYTEQLRCWPKSGRHVLAHYDAQTIVVYQAYRDAIARYALSHGMFGGEFSFGRMSWIKTNFLWMMFRSGWGTKPNQETTLAITIQRSAFDQILAQAVASNFDPALHASREEWQEALARSAVRLQWDPDHDPSGAPVERRAVQLGLRGEVLRRYAAEWIVQIEDVSEFVAVQRKNASSGSWADLEIPIEQPYIIHDQSVVMNLGLSQLH